MNEQTQARLVRELRAKRSAINGPIPTYDSLIGFSLFLLLCEYEVAGTTARLKDIYLELGRSQGGVRRLLRKLAADGWIEISRSDGDQRNRHVLATAKLKRKIAEYLKSIHA